jgi:hypothetical protein
LYPWNDCFDRTTRQIIVIGCVRYFGSNQQLARVVLRAQRNDSPDAM